MSNVEGEPPEFDDLDLGELGGDQPEEPLPLDELGALPGLEPTEAMLQPGGETVETGEADALIQPIDEGAAADMAGLAPVEVKPEEEEEPEEEEKEKGPSLLARLTKTSPYVVLLGIATVAMVIAVLCLLGEYLRYQ